jgi:hypothetical protein
MVTLAISSASESLDVSPRSASPSLHVNFSGQHTFSDSDGHPASLITVGAEGGNRWRMVGHIPSHIFGNFFFSCLCGTWILSCPINIEMVGFATMITKAQAAALRVTWKTRAGTLKCLHHYLFSTRINPKRSKKNYRCMDCGAGVVRQFTPSAGNSPQISSPK